MTTKKQFATVDEYIGSFPADVQTVLEQLRELIRKTVPEAEETISYQMPTYKLNGSYLVYFAAWKNHVGFYPTGSGTEAFKGKLGPYKQSKGSVHFPFDKPIPYDLVEEIVRFRMKEAAVSV